jgi:hypothetical protein
MPCAHYYSNAMIITWIFPESIPSGYSSQISGQALSLVEATMISEDESFIFLVPNFMLYIF